MKEYPLFLILIITISYSHGQDKNTGFLSGSATRQADSLFQLAQYSQAISKFEEALSFATEEKKFSNWMIKSVNYMGLAYCHLLKHEDDIAYQYYLEVKAADNSLGMKTSEDFMKNFEFLNLGWRYLFTDGQNDHYFDKKTLIMDNGEIEVWLIMVDRSIKAKKGKHINKSNNYSLMLYRIDCQGNRKHYLEYHKYVNGNLKESDRVEDTWQRIIPNTIMSNIKDILCSLNN